MLLFAGSAGPNFNVPVRIISTTANQLIVGYDDTDTHDFTVDVGATGDATLTSDRSFVLATSRDLSFSGVAGRSITFNILSNSVDTKINWDTGQSFFVDGGTGNVFVSTNLNFGADAQADDDYEISLPGVAVLTTGLTVTFTATTLNTNASTLEITEVGDIDALVKAGSTAADALVTGDIVAGQVVVAVFDGTNWQITSRLAQ